MRQLLSVLLLLSLAWPAAAGVTMSGKIESYNGGTGILVLKLNDGSLKNFKLDKNTKVEWMGRNGSVASLPQGTQVAVRLCGAINENPAPINLVTDWGNSSKYVATAAKSPYYTRQGQYATAAGVGGVPEGAPINNDPATTIGMLGNGGIAPTGPPPGVLTGQATINPMLAPGVGGMPMNQGAKMSMPMNMMNNGMMNNGMGQMGFENGGAGSLMGLDGEDGGMMGSNNYGAGQVSIQARVLQADPTTQTLMVQSFSSPQPQQVIVTPGAQVDMQAFRPGAMVQITGTAVSGAIQAFSVTSAGP
ncbi:MAG: hypothetical protein AB7S38_25645 [Vulcanimicrobiota bacterium]